MEIRRLCMNKGSGLNESVKEVVLMVKELMEGLLDEERPR